MKSNLPVRLEAWVISNLLVRLETRVKSNLLLGLDALGRSDLLLTVDFLLLDVAGQAAGCRMIASVPVGLYL